MAQAHLSNGITIEFESFGEGEPILLVMGLGAQLTAWPDDFVEMLVDRGHQVIRYDNRDVGLSTKCEGDGIGTAGILKGMVLNREIDAPYNLTDMATDAIGLLNALGIEAAHVVGVSMGGMIAQTMALEFPEHVLSLTSIMSNTGDGRSGLTAPGIISRVRRLNEVNEANALERNMEMFELISGPHFDPALAHQEIEAGLARSFSPDGTQRQLAAIAASPDRTERLAQLDIPVLVVHGLADELVRPSGGIATASAVPHSRLLMFPDMGHDLPRVRWPELVQGILDNVTRARAKARALA